MKICITLLAVLCSTASLFAQTDSLQNEVASKEKKRLNLTFRLDYGVNNEPDLKKTRHFYEGEYSSFGNDWIWVKESNSAFQFANRNFLKQTNIKFDLMLSLTQQLNIGLSYKLLVQEFKTIPPGISGGFFGSTYTFFSICGTVDYEWPIPKVKNLYLNPTVSIGGFQDTYLEGRTGTNLYYDAKLALAYRFFDKLSIRAWASYDHFMYRNKRKSEIFPERDRVEKLDFQYINYGLGLSYRFFIYPD